MFKFTQEEIYTLDTVANTFNKLAFTDLWFQQILTNHKNKGGFCNFNESLSLLDVTYLEGFTQNMLEELACSVLSISERYLNLYMGKHRYSAISNRDKIIDLIEGRAS